MAPETKPELRRLQRRAVDALESAGVWSAARIVSAPTDSVELSDAAYRAADLIAAVAEFCSRQGVCCRAVNDSTAALSRLRVELIHELRAEREDVA